MQKRASMADVAAHAGVSAQTVSRVVNGSPRVDPETRRRVEEAMLACGYRVHRAARALRTGRTATIGAVVSTLATVGNSLMLEAVVDAAAERAHAVAVVTIGAGGLSGALERLRDQGVDGVVVINEASALARGESLPDGLPLVLVDSPPDDRFAGVETDHAGGAAAATAHLIGLGHTRIAHIGGPEGSYAAQERVRGWREELRRHDLVPGPLVRGRWTSASGHTAVSALLGGDRPTAVFVANDQMALGALRALAGAGVRVPDGMSVVGMDDLADAENYQPPLTTVRQHFDRLGAAAVGLLVDGVERTAGARTVVPATLVVRESTGAPTLR